MATVDDFMARFGGSGTVTDADAAKYHDRFLSDHPDDQHLNKETYHQAATEYLGKLPDDEFHQAAKSAVAQAPAEERHGLLGTLMGALGGGAAAAPAIGGGGLGGTIMNAITGGGGGAAAAGGIGGLASLLGLSSSDPKQMSEDDAAKVVNYARKERPELLQKTVQEKPWFLKALGNPIVMGALGVAASKMMKNRQS